MEFRITYKRLATILIGMSCLLAVVGIFCFFGPSIKEVMSQGSLQGFINGPSMFIAMFGGTWTISSEDGPFNIPIEACPGLIALFVFALLALAIAIVIVIGSATKKIKPNTAIGFMIAMGIFLLVAVILSFCTTKLFKIGDPSIEIAGVTAKLGAGAISYAVLGLVSIFASAGGITLYHKDSKQPA